MVPPLESVPGQGSTRSEAPQPAAGLRAVAGSKARSGGFGVPLNPK